MGLVSDTTYLVGKIEQGPGLGSLKVVFSRMRGLGVC